MHGYARQARVRDDGEIYPLKNSLALYSERNATPGLREIFRRAFFAVDHGEHQHDLAAGVAHRIDRLDRGAAGGGDVLDNDDALALQGFAFGQPLDREPGAVFLRLLAHEERGDRDGP